MIRIDAIPSPAASKNRSFGPFTSSVTAAALLGICIGMASILIDKV